MAYNLDSLLSLSAKERRIISVTLSDSLPENKTKLTQEEMNLLDSRMDNHNHGKSKNFTSKEMKKIVFSK